MSVFCIHAHKYIHTKLCIQALFAHFYVQISQAIDLKDNLFFDLFVINGSHFAL
ncbi:hypothetical protein PP583_gp58 [Pseudoalteromonas phage HS6]|uniref:hypothetical protein n=1 Tax=Pseudoalteromonas phage HS6 TaxID=1357710 RepID=UPI002329988B|nr:hypothetical protein PP583_gp58 [Pseudoalteromonas phage HS6]